jgi:hypothetical protein
MKNLPLQIAQVDAIPISQDHMPDPSGYQVQRSRRPKATYAND